MKALSVDKTKHLSICTISKPHYTEYQALVKTLSCGVCNGTDMKLIHGTFKNMNQYPMLLGHEAVGQVVEIGSKVTGLKKGDIVLLPFLYGETEGYSSGWGGYAEYTVVCDKMAYLENGMGPGSLSYDEGIFAQTVLNPEDKVDPVGAAMIITFREVLSAIRRFGFEANKNILIFGAGPVGLCFTRFCKLLGLSTVITVDIMDEKVAEAKKMGADFAWNSTKINVVDKIRQKFPNGLDYVVDAVGLNQLINQAMELIAYYGKICCYGISPTLNMNLDWSKAPYNWTLQFVQWPSKFEEAEAHNQIMAWINVGVLNPMDFISDVIPFSNILDAFKLIEERRPGTKKIVIKYDE